MFGLFRKRQAAPETVPQSAAGVSEDVLATIVPVVKVIVPDEEGPRSLDIPETEAPISRPFVSDLVVLYAEDEPSHFQFISRRRLNELGLSEEGLHLRALLNLPERPPKVEVHGTPPRQMVVAGGNFEATLLLYDGLWDQLAKSVSGELLAVAPSRDLLFVSDSAWEGAREFLTGVASKELEDKSHMLSKRILRRTSGKWVADDLAS